MDTETVDIVIPVYNEERDLVPNVRRLHAYLEARFPFPATITIVDNASTDATWPIAEYLAAELPNVRALHLDAKGRGRALRTAWLSSKASIVAYMDVDLSTDLDALLPLVAPLISGHSDLAIGSRLARGARVRRGPKRELISRAYNFLLRIGLGAKFTDAQCGFKAISAVAARRLVPAVEDQAWFFDTELLVLAQRAGMRIHEVPVDWTDDPDSRVDIAKTAMDDLAGIVRLRFGALAVALSRQVLTFATIGIASTIAYAILYALLRVFTSPVIANVLALVLTAVANTAANRRLTFGVRSRSTFWQDQVAGMGALGVAIAITSAAIALLHLTAPHAGVPAEIALLTGANAAATITRFYLLRVWFERRARLTRGPSPVRGPYPWVRKSAGE
ncbi:MAG: glycosyltransferase [Chloroflexi bacterium]|nr:MAG: glycosyltransferase [Chloroflexota bacterium]